MDIEWADINDYYTFTALQNDRSFVEMRDTLIDDKYENQYNKTRLFVDMDGTLCKFKVSTLEELYEEGYFRNRPPQEEIINAIKEINKSPDVEVYILSSYLADSKYALAEKNEWLNQHLPEIPQERRIFPPCGKDKKEYVPGGVRKNDYLLDDYTKNLVSWEPPGKGIKLINGINHTHATWKGECVVWGSGYELRDINHIVTDAKIQNQGKKKR